jgi:hypothetical protein
MKKDLPLSLEAMRKEEGLEGTAARLMELVVASRLDLADEGGWEALADQCEENGEPDDVIRVALVTAWRLVLQKLHGLVERERDVMQAVARLKRAPSSTSVLRHLEEVRKAIESAQRQPYWTDGVYLLLFHAALCALDRARGLHDRLKARGLLREK